MVGLWNSETMKQIQNPGCLHFFKQKAPDEDLRTNVFVYLLVKKNKFMVARWISDNLFLPIVELGSEPVLSDEVVAAYMLYCYPNAGPSVGVGLKEAHDNHIALEEEHEHEKRTIRAKILRDEFHVKVPDEDGCAHLPIGLVGSENTCG